jgi:hypothetical protein
MCYTIELSENGQYIRILTREDVSIDMASRWAVESDNMGRAHGIKRFLFDVRGARNIASMADNYAFAYNDLSQLGVDKGARSAILIDRDDSSHDFVETTLRNAGVNVRLFTDEAAAIQWLERPRSPT